MICSICGLQVKNNVCRFCGGISITQPLISEYDINWYKETNNTAKQVISSAKLLANFIIEGNILIKYVGKSDIVIIPDNIRIISGHCFKSATIRKVKISSNVEYIGNEPGNIYDHDGAFEFCKTLESIFFDENAKLKSIENYAFNGCIKLNTIAMLPKSIKTIKSHAFRQCCLDDVSIKLIISNTMEKGLANDWNI